MATKNVNDNGIYVDEIDGKTYGSITYATYIGFESEPSKPFIMISELIDNSISSFENSLSNWNKSKKLKIEIDFNFPEGEKIKCKSDNNKYYYEGSFVRYKDNAFGFRKEDDPTVPIDDALKSLIVYGQQNRGLSNKNKYGKGLKHCVYYFGQDLEIITSNGSKTARLERKFTDENVTINTRYPYDAEIVEPISKGTEIIISNIYEHKTFSKSTFNTLVDAISRRYVQYLKEDLIEIVFSIHSTSYATSGVEAQILEEPVRDLNETVSNSSTLTVMESFSNTEAYEEFKKNCDLEYKKRIARYSTEKHINSDERVDIKVFKDAYYLMKDKIEELVNEKPKVAKLESEIILTLKDVKTDLDTQVPFKFWMLPLRTKSTYAGIRFYEGKRAIRHVCGNDKDLKPWTGHVIVSDDSNRTPKKFAGSIDLSLISVETVKDKSGFQIPESLESDLITKTWSVYSAVTLFIIQIAKTDKRNEIKEEFPKINKELKEDVQKSLTRRSGGVEVDLVDVDEPDSTIGFEKVIQDRLWTISIKIDSESKGSSKKITAFKEGERKLLIVIYYRNELWQKIRENFTTLEAFMKDLFKFRILTLIEHSLAILKKLDVDEDTWSDKVVDVLEELGDDYIGQNISIKK